MFCTKNLASPSKKCSWTWDGHFFRCLFCFISRLYPPNGLYPPEMDYTPKQVSHKKRKHGVMKVCGITVPPPNQKCWQGTIQWTWVVGTWQLCRRHSQLSSSVWDGSVFVRWEVSVCAEHFATQSVVVCRTAFWIQHNKTRLVLCEERSAWIVRDQIFCRIAGVVRAGQPHVWPMIGVRIE